MRGLAILRQVGLVVSGRDPSCILNSNRPRKLPGDQLVENALGYGSSFLLRMASEPKQNTSVWLALRKPSLCRAVVTQRGFLASACLPTTRRPTWLMNALGVSPLLLSLIATAASLPFFVFTLPAGAPRRLEQTERNLLIAVYLWLAAAAGLLAVCTWLHWVSPVRHPNNGLFCWESASAFNAPVWGSIVPEIVQKRRTRVCHHPGRGCR